jgi:cell division protein FtsI (penicillin-binding protein 3)
MPRLFAILPIAGLLACAPEGSAAATPPPDSDPAPLEAPSDAWGAAVETEAQRLEGQWPHATVRIVVVDVDSGELLARYGPVEESHPTGSTIKSFTVAAAFAAGVRPSDVVDGSPVSVPQGEIHDAHPVDDMTVEEILVRSSNVGAVRVIQKIGAAELGRAVQEMVGLPVDPDEATATAQLFGHGSRLSTVALARGYAALANGGRDSSSGRAVVDEAAAEDVVTALQRAVDAENGTAGRARVEGISVAGKTGTAHDNERATALFFGLGPLPDPQWVVGVVVEGVDRSAYGGSVAAPAFSRIVSSAQ